MSERKKIFSPAMARMVMTGSGQLNRALSERKLSQQNWEHISGRNWLRDEEGRPTHARAPVDVPRVQISRMNVEPDVIRRVPSDLIYKHRVFPLQIRGNALILAMPDPYNHRVIEDVQMATGLNVNPVWADEEDLDVSIRNFFSQDLDPQLENIIQRLKAEPRDVSLDELRTANHFNDAPIIQVIDAALKKAVRHKASDVHLEPRDNETRIRFRIDGLLNTAFAIPKVHHPALISRVKIMGGMDIAEKRIPQDGRFSMQIDQRRVDFRASTMPVAGGEKAVLRILDPGNTLTAIGELGLSLKNQEKLLQLACLPHGLILITGPTGSGKTTTLYSMLNEANKPEKNLITLEDPVEYSLDGINQVQINPRTGLTFASGLRACFRQDPDIIMVGEIRDAETAELAVRAALTGHVVFSTLHTNNAVGAVARLADMGVERFLLGSCLAGVIAQRLVRQLCRHCRKGYILDQEMAGYLGIPHFSGEKFYRAVGCPACRGQGYQGRIAIQEILVISGELRTLINRVDIDEDTIIQEAKSLGFIDIKEDGILKAQEGMTSLEEVVRAVLWAE